MGVLVFRKRVGLWTAVALAAVAQEPPQMPMQARFEDGANYRWLNKPVAESRLLDSMESLSNWKFGGAVDVSLTETRAQDGSHSLRMRGLPRAGGSEWDGISVTRTFAGEDWSRYNRISVWVYPDMAGAPAISFSMTLHNDGAHKLPDRYNEGRHESIILKNHAWNRVVWEIAPLDRDKITALDLGYSQPKRIPDPGDRTLLDIDKLELERVDADYVEGWSVAPGRIAFSHSGYTAGAPKSAVASDLKASEFRIVRQDTGEVALTKPVRRTKTDLGEFQVLDFSELREPGEYAIQAGGAVTRSFRIGDDAWRSSIWKAINFLYSERCGMEIPGIHGKCHQDCYSKHGDLRIVVNGGWHDAGDLTATGHIPGISYSLFALAERLERQGQDAALSKRLIEEAKWGLDWVLKTRFGDGFRTSGQLISVWTDGIMGDADDRSGEARNDPEFHFRDCATEAIAYRVLQHSDPELAARSLEIAREDWDYGVKGLESAAPFTPVYGAVDELQRTSIGLLATVDLYQATGEKRYAEKAYELARMVMASQQRSLPEWKIPLTGFFYTSPARQNLFQRFHIGEEQAPIVAMVRMCEAFPDHAEWMKWYSAAVLHSEYYLKRAAQVNAPYDVLPAAVYRESDAKLIPEQQNWTPLRAADREAFVEQVRRGIPLGGEYFLRRMPVWFDFRGNFSVLLSQTKALAAAAQLRGDLDAADLAQRQAQWVVGRNPFAASTMYGEGYDWAPLYTVRSGHMVGALPVGIQSRGFADAPYWPTQICWTYKEVWVHPVGRWLWLMQDLAGPALVEGLVKPATHEPLEFREKSTGQVTTVAADFVGGTFRTLLPEGRYTVTQGDRHTSLTVLPGGSYRVDLRPGEAFDFQATAESAPNGAVTIRISAEGSGRHRFTIRTENLALDGAERVIELAPGKPATLAWSGSVASRDTPSVAVVVPDGSLVQRRELTGVPAAR
jgi:hypothetical protein